MDALLLSRLCAGYGSTFSFPVGPEYPFWRAPRAAAGATW
jgi:hypothetical protein